MRHLFFKKLVKWCNFIKSKSERTDVSNILGLAVGSNSSSSGSSSKSSGMFGDGIDVTISNTMLSKLLNTEMFGTRVSNIILDTIKVNEITAKYAKFEGLAKGTTIIDGKCITTGYIIDKHYNGTNGNISNTQGSVINLETGLFNFGGGSLKYDGNSLSIEGSIIADSGYIGGTSGFVIGTGKLYSNGHSSYNTNCDGVYLGTDYIALGSGGVTWFKNDGTGKIGSWRINNNSIYRNNANWGASGGMYFGTSGLSISDKFKVDSNGNMTATGVNISGVITATSGSFTGNIYANNGYFKGDITGASGTFSGLVSGGSINIGNSFKVWSNGTFSLASGKISYNGSTLSFSGDVTLSWSQITGTGNVANKSDIPSDSYITQITKNTVTTEYLVANNLHVKSANIDGQITASQINTYGLIAENISASTIYGKTLSGGSISGSSITCGSKFTVTSNGDVFCNGGVFENIFLKNNVYIQFGDTGYPLITTIGQGHIAFANQSSHTDFLGSMSFGSSGGTATALIDSAGRFNFNKDVYFYNLSTESGTANVRIGNQGKLKLISGSLRKLKHAISQTFNYQIHPHRLYDIKLYQFIYNLDYLSLNDCRYNKVVPGMMVDDLIKDYPIAVDYDENGNPENWNERYIIPPMLYLIQEQHKQLQELQFQFNIMQCEYNLLKQQLNKLAI